MVMAGELKVAHYHGGSKPTLTFRNKIFFSKIIIIKKKKRKKMKNEK